MKSPFYLTEKTYDPSPVKSGHLPPEVLLQKVVAISEAWADKSQVPALTEVAAAAALARHAHLTSVRYLRLHNLDLSAVPAADLAALASSVSARVFIDNVRGDLTPVLRDCP